MSAMEMTERVMGALIEHLRERYPVLTSSNVFRLQANAAGTLTLILDLLSPKLDAPAVENYIDSGEGDDRFLRDVNCGLQFLPTFQVVFTPMAIVSDQDSPPPSSRILFNVQLVNYQGNILKKDFVTFYVNFPREVVDGATSVEAGVADVSTDFAEKSSSYCDLLQKLDAYREFRLCCGVRNNRESPMLKNKPVFIEPFGDGRKSFVVRSRACRFMLELEMAENGEDPNKEPVSLYAQNCRLCAVLEANLTEIGVEKLKHLPSVKIEVKEEQVDDSDVTGIFEAQEVLAAQELLAAVDDAGDYDEEEHPNEHVSIIKDGKKSSFVCSHCDKSFRVVDQYWRHVKTCNGQQRKKLTPEQSRLMETRKGADDKCTCSNCGRDFFHEVNCRKHEQQCRLGRIKSKAIYKQAMKKLPKSERVSSKIVIKDTAVIGEEEEEDQKKNVVPTDEDKAKVVVKQRPKYYTSKRIIRQCPICLRKVGNQWDRHMNLHKERVGDKLTEPTVCPSWDCDIEFYDRLELNRHFLEQHDAEAIPCVYCVRLIQRDRILHHIRNEHPHTSHMCTECGRECIYLNALKQHIKEHHHQIRDSMCDLCGKSYPNERLLRKHLKTHATLRDHICSECGKDFLTTSKLHEHLRVHTGAKPYHCKVCTYKACRKENMQAHIRKVHNITTNVNTYIRILPEELKNIDVRSKKEEKDV